LTGTDYREAYNTGGVPPTAPRLPGNAKAPVEIPFSRGLHAVDGTRPFIWVWLTTNSVAVW